MTDREDDLQPTGKSPQGGVSRIGPNLHRLTEFVDSSGKVIQRMVIPLRVEFQFRDVAEIIVGACVLAIPVSFTEEVWELGSNLPLLNAIAISLLSGVFVAIFVYVKFYLGSLREHVAKFMGRVVATYLITLVVAVVLLALLQKLPVVDDPATAVKRAFLVAFPGVFSATVVDSLK